MFRSRGRRLIVSHAWTIRLAVLSAALALVPAVHASELSSSTRARLAAGQPVQVIVEFDGSLADRSAARERQRRGLRRDDPSILSARAQAYSLVKSAVESAAAGADARRMLDYDHLPLSLWRLSSLNALSRLQQHASVRAVHEDLVLHPVSVSDLGFINQPQAAAAGATGAGTTIAVIDGGLGSNYLTYSDFGICTAVNTPPSTCRVVFNQDFYPASSVIMHGTNVSAIALGVAPGAKLAMYNVFDGATTSAGAVLLAMNFAIANQAAHNIVAINLSLGDNSSHSTQCPGSVFATAVANARDAGILTVVAAGNTGSKTGLGEPACTPGVVSVGAVYDAAYGARSWSAPAVPGGQCTDAATAPDKVPCFSQSASYLSIFAPGTFVNAPDASFQLSGTSQAAPHVAGTVAVLRARYPGDSLEQTIDHLLAGGAVTDTAAGLSRPRLDLLAAINDGLPATGDVPLPLWAHALLGIGLLTALLAHQRYPRRRLGRARG